MSKVQRRDDFINGPVYSNIATKFRLINNLVDEYAFRYNDPWYGLKILEPNPSSTIMKIEKAMSIYEFIGDDPRLYEVLTESLSMLIQYKEKCDKLGINYDEKLLLSISDYVKDYTDLIIEFETEDDIKNTERLEADSEFDRNIGFGNSFGVISISRELRELKALLDEGVLTQEEFVNMKQVILKIGKRRSNFS